MDALRVRMYNVRFGDAFLVSVPDRTTQGAALTRHILIDVGNSYSSEGGADSVFAPVVDDILSQVGEQGLDLYVMSHAHMDHIQGLPYTNRHTFPAHDLGQRLNIHHAWLPIFSHPQYGDEHSRAALHAAAEIYQEVVRTAAINGVAIETVSNLLEANNPRLTSDCVNYLRGLAPQGKTWYVQRDMDMTGKHDFQEARFDIWAPEAQAEVYFKAVHPLAIGAPKNRSKGAGLVMPRPPHGVDAGAFYQLVESRGRRWVEALLAIDQSFNNTSIVFCLEWCGKRLLFTGDAELLSWNRMAQANKLKPVDFLKVSHHGSYNGTPPLDLLERVLPGAAQMHQSALSSYRAPYKTIPDAPTLALIQEHSQLVDIRSDPERLYVDIFIPPGQ